MNKPNISKFFKKVKFNVSKHSPEILTGIGIAGMITTTVLAVKATPKAIELIEEEKQNREEMTESPIKTMDYVKVAWKPYIPAAVTCIVSTACLIGASSVNSKRNAALAAAYNLSKTALTEYKEKVVETIGEKKEQIVKEKVAKEKIEKNPVGKNEIIITGKGDILCLDAISHRYFESDLEKINKITNELNKRMLSEMYISLTEFYNEIGLEPTKISDDLGWNLDDGLIELDISSQITDDGRPCIVIDYLVAPRYDYSKLY